eukprot:TRINITY_DN2250_c0_g1_i13.p1 TRINITY_DN2250_c0_g1~~TRINITY_DN2250_c0_g1_i13.p1  ORF type:complete len:563 (-),score=38.69 TRINITY_DN2250_c0_g1_i13:213-1814(-)
MCIRDSSDRDLFFVPLQVRPMLDNWARARITLHKRQPVTIPEENPLRGSRNDRSFNSTGSHTGSEQRQRTYAKAKSKILLEEVPDADIPGQPIPLELKEANIEEYAEEDMMRIQKAVEMQRRKEDEELQKKREKELSEQQHKLGIKITTDLKKNYTYDYNGNVFITNPVKIERLPNMAVSSNFKVLGEDGDKDLESPLRKDSKPSSVLNSLGNTQSKNLRKAPTQDREFAKYVSTSSLYEILEPASGVVMIESGRVKYGPKPANLSLNLSSPTLPVTAKLSKSEYMQLVKGGNLSRQTNNVNETFKIDPHGHAKSRVLNLLDSNKSHDDFQSPKLFTSMDLSGKSKRLNISGDNTNDSIKITSIELLESVLVEAGRDFSYEDSSMVRGLGSNAGRSRYLPTLNNTYDSEFDEELEMGAKRANPMSDIDKFNLNIVQSKDFGRNPPVNSYGSSMLLPKRKNDKIKLKSLAAVQKHPRDRIRNDVAVGHEHMAAPPIGKTIGHGIKSQHRLNELNICSHLSFDCQNLKLLFPFRI